MLGAALAVLASHSLRAFGSRTEPRPIAQPANSQHSSRISTGPWGTLVCEKISLTEEDQVFADGRLRLKPVRWEFAGYSRQQLNDLLASCRLGESEKSYLLDPGHWERLSNGFAISPPDQLVMGLSPESRAHLYWNLATNSANYPQYIPFNFAPSGIDERFAEGGLPPDKIEMIRKLAYPGFGYLWLAVDQPLLRTFDTNELQQFLHVLYSCPAWMLRLQLKPDTDANALLQYWGKGREKKLQPLLESLVASPGGRAIGIGALLPPFAQARLYTYPDPEADPLVLQEDCFYSSMNFFNDPPDPRYTQIAYTRAMLQSNYNQVQPPGKFGDVVIVNDSAGNGIHACVFIADDFVFTKNGGNTERPWVIMKMADVLACFPSESGEHLVFYRRKGY